MVSVLVVEDSPVARELLVHILEADAGIRVLGAVGNGVAALEFLAHHKPDIVTMDIHLPHMDGFETTRRIMETHPVPIVIVSASLNIAESNLTFRALEAGALDAVEKPRGEGHPDHAVLAARLVQCVKTMAEVKVIKRWPRAATPAQSLLNAPSQNEPSRPQPVKIAMEIRVVVIGASTGGPPVLQTILSALPKDFPVPILIVQHIAAGFTHSMAEWLRHSTGFAISVGKRGEHLQSGRAYFAPDHHHMGIDRQMRVALSDAPPENGLRPAVSFLFRSAHEICGAQTAAVLLTGMGRDGAEELRALRMDGAVTLAQDAETSVVHGMPGEAIKIGGACFVLPPRRIAAMLESLVLQRP